MIEVKNLHFVYEEEFVLKNINLEVKEGSLTAIIGANGSGKTTLAKHLNALLMPTKGNVIVDGLDTKQNEFEVRKKVGFVLQNFEDQIIYPVVEEDVAFGLENLGLKSTEIVGIVDRTLNRLKIKSLAKNNVNALSYGQKQLVALAGVLAMMPKFIVLDEPTTMLDAKNKRNIIDVVKDLNKKDRIAVLFITNIIDDLRHFENVIVLKDGNVIFNDKKSRLSKKILKEAGLHD